MYEILVKGILLQSFLLAMLTLHSLKIRWTGASSSSCPKFEKSHDEGVTKNTFVALLLPNKWYKRSRLYALVMSFVLIWLSFKYLLLAQHS